MWWYVNGILISQYSVVPTSAAGMKCLWDIEFDGQITQMIPYYCLQIWNVCQTLNLMDKSCRNEMFVRHWIRWTNHTCGAKPIRELRTMQFAWFLIFGDDTSHYDSSLLSAEFSLFVIWRFFIFLDIFLQMHLEAIIRNHLSDSIISENTMDHYGRRKKYLGAYAMLRVAAGAHLPTPLHFEPCKTPRL